MASAASVNGYSRSISGMTFPASTSPFTTRRSSWVIAAMCGPSQVLPRRHPARPASTRANTAGQPLFARTGAGCRHGARPGGGPVLADGRAAGATPADPRARPGPFVAAGLAGAGGAAAADGDLGLPHQLADDREGPPAVHVVPVERVDRGG